MRRGSRLARSAGCVAALGCVAVSGCGTAADGPAPTTTPPAAAGRFVPGAGDRSGLVDIGGGRDIYLECRGSGSPTVVLVSGAGVAADNWSFTGDPTDQTTPPVRTESAVHPEIAKFTRVCAYDRPGTEQMDGTASRSTGVPQPTTAQGDATDLRALLTVAELAGPHVLVGHSWGGMIASAYARTYPDDVSGLVLVDPGSEYLQSTLPPAVWDQWMRDIETNGRNHPGAETPDYPATLAALETMPPLPAMPAAVLTSDEPFDYLGIGDADTYWPQWLDAAALLSTALDATHITQTGSGHFIENENPALVVEQVCSVIAPATSCPGE
ncbi:alpha/beta fold hydrolase [Rhodococcus sp. T7]|uniref:alpha/beta fold hydrolase n=1 Tax=Rhodococcus sp. T7 TaxID=627444 RepID=UPI0013567E7C|nr:alpha/beta hydrolase [Rhodococcus sp. T7]KAF0964974.1 hypothetical protein MLGJGCBP_01847 [Rhodococcus sp. T7]